MLYQTGPSIFTKRTWLLVFVCQLLGFFDQWYIDHIIRSKRVARPTPRSTGGTGKKLAEVEHLWSTDH